MNIKSKIITYLLVLSFLLLVTNLVFESTTRKPETKPNFITISKSEQLLYNVLVNYGLKNEWIEKRKLIKKVDSISYYFKIRIPSEIPTTVIIADLNGLLRGYNAELSSDESKIDGNSILNIYSNNQVKLKAELVPHKDLDRERNSIALLIEGLTYENEDKLLQILKNSIPVTIVLQVNENNLALPELINKFDKKYAVLLDDNVDGDKFLMDTEYSKSRLEEAVKSIISAYRGAKLFFIDEHSDLYKSGIFNYVSEQFEQRGIHLHKAGEIVNLKNKNKQDIISLFDFYCNNEEFQDGFPASVSYGDFIILEPLIIKYKKMGNEFVFASEIIKTN